MVHIADADWRFEYAGECEPAGIAVRRTLTDLQESDSGRDVVDHKLTCALETGRAYEVRVNAVAGDAARHRAVLRFSSSAAPASRSVSVRNTRRLSRRSVDQLFGRYVRDAVLEEIEVPLIRTLAALLVAEIAERSWKELGVREAIYGTVSETVSYASRSPSGATAELSGLVAMPDVGDFVRYIPPDRVVLLAHATGSTPSRLSRLDGWYVLANLLAGRGYLVVAPDNWGRGDTAGADQPETYLMANRIANNGLDMLREVLAVERYSAFHRAAETVETALIGYSQGAHSVVAMWLASAAAEDRFAVSDVYAGGGPHDLYRTVRGALESLEGRCDGNAWCRGVDPDVIEPYASDRILPAFLRYADVGLTLDDVVDGGRLSATFIAGMLGSEARFDKLKTLLQLNSFTNVNDLGGTLADADTRIVLYHSPFDRLVPFQNTANLVDALAPEVHVAAHPDACESNAFGQLGELVGIAGVVHAICAFEMFDRVLRDLREGEAARTGHDRASEGRLDPASPWRSLAERHGAAALADTKGIAAFRDGRSQPELRALRERLRAADSPTLRELADRL